MNNWRVELAATIIGSVLIAGAVAYTHTTRGLDAFYAGRLGEIQARLNAMAESLEAARTN
jgi:hypothetical protein